MQKNIIEIEAKTYFCFDFDKNLFLHVFHMILRKQWDKKLVLGRLHFLKPLGSWELCPQGSDAFGLNSPIKLVSVSESG